MAKQPENIVKTELPDWLKKLAWEVHSLVEFNGVALEQFRDMVSRWSIATDRDMILPLSDPSHGEPASHHERSIEEQYTILAAIHDRYCTGVVSINPWEKAEVDCLDGVSFAGLLHDISTMIYDDDEHVLNAFFRRIKADLANSGERNSQSHKPMKYQGNNSLDKLENPLSCITLAAIVQETSSNVAAKLKRHDYLVIQVARKSYCDAKHAMILWPHKRAAFEKYLKPATE